MCTAGMSAHGHFACHCVPSTYAFQQGLQHHASYIDHAKLPGHIFNPATFELKQQTAPNKISSKERSKKKHFVQRNTRQPLLSTS
jgi:hypothetical protein